jgi:hypothetical protein
MTPEMHRLAKYERLVVSGISASALVLFGGVVANFGKVGIAAASGLLTAAAMVMLAGSTYAKNRRAGTAVIGLIAAALPLFFGFYVGGLTVLRYLGQTASSLLLIVLSIALSAGTLLLGQEWRHRAPR